MNTPAVLTALAAAVLFGWSTALMHHSASTATVPLEGIVALVRYLVVQWRWLLGMAASLTGLVMHVVALGLGSLAVVQPLVVTGLVFSFVFRAALDRQLLGRVVLGWVLLVAVGLALFLVTIGNTDGAGAPDHLAVVVMLGGGALLAMAAFAASLSRPTASSGFLLGLSAGAVFGLIAGVLKAATYNSSQGVPFYANWAVYAVIPLGVSGFLLNQRAYHAAPLTASLPVLNLVNPLLAVLFGVLAFHERTHGTALENAAGVAGLAAVLVGVFFLGRQPVPEAQPAPEVVAGAR